MVEVEVLIKSIEGTKLANDAGSDTDVTFNANASLTEGERNPGQMSLKFVIELETQPEVAKISVSGSAIIKGEDASVDALLAVKGNDSIPPIFLKIYQKVYSVTYLLCGSLKIPYPSPGLLNSVHVAAPREMSRPVETRVEPRVVEKEQKKTVGKLSV